MKILVTGASGFLGSALARAFRDEAHEVALVLRPASSLRRLEGLAFDVRRCADRFEAAEAVREFRPDAVVHTACAYGRRGEGASELLESNVAFGLALLASLGELPSGASPRLFLNTGTSLPADVGPYALSKRQFSAWGRQQAQAAAGRLRFVDVALEHMYGPGDDESKFPTHVLHACRDNVPSLKLTEGAQLRDFIYIDDVVGAYSTLLAHAAAFAEPCVEIPVGSGEAVTVRSFVETAHALTGSRTSLEFGAVPYRPNEAMHCQADIRTMRALGWRPIFDVRAGLEKTIHLEN